MSVKYGNILNNTVLNRSKENSSKKVDTSDPTNITRDVKSECRVVLYKWKQNALTSQGTQDNKLSASERIDISSKLLRCSFTKSLSNPSGTFSFTLANHVGYKNYTDWKDLIKPGMWCTIMMSQDGDIYPSKKVGKVVVPLNPEKVRCVGYIERVAIQSELNEKGAFDATFVITGRDFGVIYEETAIWHNLFKYERTALDALAGSKLKITAVNPKTGKTTTIDEVLETVHDLFYAPQKIKELGLSKKSDSSLTELAKQWLLPTELIKDLNMSYSGASYYGNVKDVLNFQKTTATIAVTQPLDFLSGNVWQRLNELAIREFHELFPELDDKGHLKLNFRPIPWGIDKKNYLKAGKNIELYKNLQPRVKVDNVDILFYNLGEDNHNRKNHFLTTVVSEIWNVQNNIRTLQNSKFPFQIKDSIKRHGFKPIHTTINSFTMNEMENDGTPERPKLIEYNEIMFDYWNNAVFFESGPLEKIGSNDVRVGKTLEFADSVPYVNGKVYYIEEYTDSYMYLSQGVGEWTQSVQLTRGAEKTDLEINKQFSFRNKELKDVADYTEDDDE